MLKDHSDDAEEHAEIVQASRICAWIVRHEKEQQDEDEILHAKREPIYAPPTRILSQDTREESCN